MHCSLIKALIAVLYACTVSSNYVKAHMGPGPIFAQVLILHCKSAYTASDNAPVRKECLAIRDYSILPMIFLIRSCARPLKIANKLNTCVRTVC